MAEPRQEIAAPRITRTRYTVDFSEIGIKDVAQVGGKAATIEKAKLLNINDVLLRIETGNISRPRRTGPVLRPVSAL